MSNTFYAVVDDKNDLAILDFNDEILPNAIFSTESQAYACMIRCGNDSYRVVPVNIIRRVKND